MSSKIVGVAGGSGSGKTTFASKLRERLGQNICSIIAQDHYYLDQSERFDHDGGSVNFDHPSSIDFSLMASHLKSLKAGEDIRSPRYCFETHTRKIETFVMTPKKVIIVDGILLFSQKEILKCLDHKIFIDCDENLRFKRRLLRDVNERGRTPEGVKLQFINQVKPMHDVFVEPSKDVACDLVNQENFQERLDFWAAQLLL